MSTPSDLGRLQKKIWSGSIPLEVRLASSDCQTFDECDPYLVWVSRYLLHRSRLLLMA